MNDKKPLDIKKTAEALGAEVVSPVSGLAEAVAIHQKRQQTLRGDEIALDWPPPCTVTRAQIPEAEALCQNCGERQATENWVGKGSALDYVHGMSQKWCKRCCLEAQLEHAVAVAGTIPELVQQLKDLEN